MSISDLSIRRPVFAWMLMSALIIFGGIAFMRMGISQLPDVDFPVVSISLTLDGAAPEVMEADIVDVVEDSLMSLEGLTTISSTSKSGTATITVEFDISRNIDLAMQDVQNKLYQAQRKLPTEMDPPVVSKSNPEDQPIIWITVDAQNKPLRELMLYVQTHLRDQFSTVPGVGDITLGGYVDPALRVWVQNDKLKQYVFTVTDVINAIKSEHVELPGGQLQRDSKEFNVRTMGEAKTVEEFRNLKINTRAGKPNYQQISLGDVAEIEPGLAEVRRISRTNGNSALGIGVRKQRGTNAVEVAQAVKRRMAEIQKGLPEGMHLSVVFDSTKFVEEAVHELNFTLLLSALLTSLVCYLFLGSLASTVNVLLAIPTSIVGTFIVLGFSGFTLNTFTLLGLSLAIGIVVDDAIMVLENITRHFEMGKDRVRSAKDGAREITFAALAATISIIAIFLPVVFMKGVIGKFFYQFGITMTVAVALSLVEALTLTPMRCAQFMSHSDKKTRVSQFMDWAFGYIENFYAKTLSWSLDHRWTMILSTLAFFVASLLTVPHVRQEFIPAEDQSRFMIRIQTPVGSSLDYTDQKFREAEKFLITRPEIDRYYLAVGNSSDVNQGIVFITMKAKGKRGVDPVAKHELSQMEFMGVVRKALNKIPDVKAIAQDLSMRGFTASRGTPVEFSVRGADFDKLAVYAQQIMKELEAQGKVTDLDTDYQLAGTEVQFVPKRQAAALRGVSVSDVGQTVNAAVGGINVAKYSEEGHRYDIRLRLTDKERADIKNLKDLYIKNNQGDIGRLGEVVDIVEKPALPSINRKDRERAVSVFANLRPGASQSDVLKDVEALGKKVLPPGYRLVFSGSAQSFQESMGSLKFAMILGLFVAYMVLASQFNSFIDPLTVLLALPFSLSGAFIALLITNNSLNIYSYIGLILLMGIVKKNSILLVDFTNQVRDQEKLDIRRSLERACPVRLRPILMTSFATIAGAIPAAMAIGPGAESRIPMADAVIGGVLVSTILTLYVVPCAYSLMSNVAAKVDPGEVTAGDEEAHGHSHEAHA